MLNRLLEKLQAINLQLDVLRYQTIILLDFELISLKRYRSKVSQSIHSLAGHLKHENTYQFKKGYSVLSS